MVNFINLNNHDFEENDEINNNFINKLKFEIPEDFFGDEDEFDNKIKNLFNEHLFKFLEKNQNLKNISYIGVHTNYVKKIMDIITLKNLDAELIYDYGGLVLTKNNELLGLIKNNSSFYGSVVFKSNDPMEYSTFIDKLDKQDYCSCCNLDNLFHVKWYEPVKGTIIMLCFIDNEKRDL
jgi:hypothetical protein